MERQGLDEIGYDLHTGRELIFVSEEFYRPCEVDLLLGNALKAKQNLQWSPNISFEELVNEMVAYDCS